MLIEKEFLFCFLKASGVNTGRHMTDEIMNTEGFTLVSSKNRRVPNHELIWLPVIMR